MKEKPSTRVRVQGYTDMRLTMSRYRTRSPMTMKQYFVAKGINKSSLSLEGFGQSNPVATNATLTGKAENRQAELFQQ